MAELNIAEQLRLFRHRTGLNCTDFCKRYKLSRSAYSQWESGLKPPSGAALILLQCILIKPVEMEKIINEIQS